MSTDVSSSCSSSEWSSSSNECEDFEEVEREVEDTLNDETSGREEKQTKSTDFSSYAYDEEPLASEEWVANYLKEQEENNELEKDLKMRLSGETPTKQW